MSDLPTGTGKTLIFLPIGLAASRNGHRTAILGSTKQSELRLREIGQLPLPPDAVLMVETARQLNYAPEAWLLTRGTAVAPFAIPALGGAGNLTVGVMSAFPWQPAVPYAGNLLGHTINNSQIFNEYEAAWHHPLTLEGVYFTEVLIAADAIAKAGTLDRVAIREALRSTTFQTALGQVSSTPGGQWVQSDKFMLMMQWQNLVVNGATIQALQILEPTNVAATNYIVYPFSWTNQTHKTWHRLNRVNTKSSEVQQAESSG